MINSLWKSNVEILFQEWQNEQGKNLQTLGTHNFLSIGFGQPEPAKEI